MATKSAATVCIGGFLFSFVFHTCQMIRFEHGSFPLSHLQTFPNGNQFKHSLLNRLNIQNDRTREVRLVHPFKASNNFHRDISLPRKTTQTLLSNRKPISPIDTSTKKGLPSQGEKHWPTLITKQQLYPTTRKPGLLDVNRVLYNPPDRLPSRQPVPISDNVISRQRLPSRQPVPRTLAMRLRQSMPSRQPIPRMNLRSRQPVPSRKPFPGSNTLQLRQPVPFRRQFPQSSVIRSSQPVPSRQPVSRLDRNMHPRQPSRSRQSFSPDGKQSKDVSNTDTTCVERDQTLFPDRKPSRQPFPTPPISMGTAKHVRRTNVPRAGNPQGRQRKRPVGSRTRSKPRHTGRFGRGGPMGINHSGSCSKLCSNLCVFGYVMDSSGCQTCRCRRSDLWTCSNAYCSFQCPFGYEQDAFGCRTCKCTFKLLMDYLNGILTINKPD